MKAGERVFHCRLGRGVVERVISKGAQEWVVVDFGYMKESLKLEDLQPSDQKDDSPRTYTKATRGLQIRLDLGGSLDRSHRTAGRKEDEPSPLESRKGIVALRLGQILESQVSLLSVGTDYLENIFQSAVERAAQRKPVFILVEGVWGGGKTHALTLLQALAHQKGFASSSLVMDGGSVSFSEPMQLIEEILNSLVFPKQVDVWNIGEVMRNIVKGGKIPDLKMNGASDLAQILARFPGDIFDDLEAVGVIQDYLSLSLSATQAKNRLNLLGYKPPSLIPIRVRRVQERNQAFCILLLNWANLLQVAGSRGLLVILDELDVEYAATAFGDVLSGKRKGLRKHLLLLMRQMVEHRAPLVIALGSAPGGEVQPEDDAVEDILSVFGAEITHIQVPVPVERDLTELFGKLCCVYRKAYPCNNNMFTNDHLESILQVLLERHRMRSDSVPRHFVRSAIEALDVITCCEDLSFDRLLDLIIKS